MDAIPLRIDVVSDVVCPWCIIGYKQLHKALAETPHNFEVSLTWHPFELNPNMGDEGENLREHLAKKYGTTKEQSVSARARLTALGESLGFSFDYFDEMRVVNTFRAHQLLHWARSQGRQTELKLALFAAFFSERQDVSKIDVLVAAAAHVGLAADEARQLLCDARFARAVRDEQRYWLAREVHAVPTFMLNDSYPIPGAQDARTFLRILDKAAEMQAA
ncbi:MAG: DsbA family oxidoreductase [Pseudomonadota bacterium]